MYYSQASNVYVQVAKILQDQGKYKEAAEYYLQASNVYSQAANILEGQEKYKEAAEYYLKAAKTLEGHNLDAYARIYYSQSSNLYVQAAKTLQKQGKHVDAAWYYLQASNLYVQAAKILQELKKDEEAIDNCRQAIDNYKQVIENYNKLSKDRLKDQYLVTRFVDQSFVTKFVNTGEEIIEKIMTTSEVDNNQLVKEMIKIFEKEIPKGNMVDNIIAPVYFYLIDILDKKNELRKYFKSQFISNRYSKNDAINGKIKQKLKPSTTNMEVEFL